MYKTVSPGAMSQSRSAGRECCGDPDCGAGLRNNYFDGKRITPDTFRVEQRYLVGRRRLLNRAVHGWGLVYGFPIAVVPARDGRDTTELRIGAGLVLDECGRELVELGAEPIGLDELIVLDPKGRRVDRESAFISVEQSRNPNGGTARLCWQLSVNYAERDDSPIQVVDPCLCQQQEWDHVCETIRYTLRAVPCADCCDTHPCELTCGCASGPCCEPHPRKYDEKYPVERHTAEERWRAEVPPERGGCRCLCDHLTDLGVADGCDDRLCEIEERRELVRVDLKHGVPLACITIERDECGDWKIGSEVQACGPRRLVKRNDLLFDLIRGCDLTRISEIGWKAWHRREEPVPFVDFSAALGPEGQRKSEYVTRDFWIRFSRPVRQETVRPDCFTITVLGIEREGGWWQGLRVPIVAVDTNVVDPERDDPAGHVRGARIVVDGSWMEDGVRGRRSLFLGGETRIEIEVRADFIVDCNGQPVDANAIGLSTTRTGNGSPGGTFMSGFRVAAAREAPDRVIPNDNIESPKGVRT
jgi:hypothetical protein